MTPRTKNWIRSNRTALIALAVLFPLTFGVMGYREWHDSYGEWPTSPVKVQAGDNEGGVFWGEVQYGPAGQYARATVPSGAQTVLLHLSGRPVDEPVACEVLVLRETGGQRRSWEPAMFALDLPEQIEERTGCDAESGGEFQLVVPFVLPADATGPFALDVEVPSITPKFLRFDASF